MTHAPAVFLVVQLGCVLAFVAALALPAYRRAMMSGNRQTGLARDGKLAVGG